MKNDIKLDRNVYSKRQQLIEKLLLQHPVDIQALYSISR
jgi:hypothetical protein